MVVSLGTGVCPNHLLAAVLHLDSPVLVRHLGRTIVAACPDEVATGASIWDALRRPQAPIAAADPMAGGWMGLLADRLAGTVELLPGSPPDDAGPPAGVIARYPAVFVVDDDGNGMLVAERPGNEADALLDAAHSRTGALPGAGSHTRDGHTLRDAGLVHERERRPRPFDPATPDKGPQTDHLDSLGGNPIPPPDAARA